MMESLKHVRRAEPDHGVATIKTSGNIRYDLLTPDLEVIRCSISGPAP
jgi:hypothetical protein